MCWLELVRLLSGLFTITLSEMAIDFSLSHRSVFLNKAQAFLPL